MIKKILLLINTIKYLKLTQVFYQIVYKLSPKHSLSAYHAPTEIVAKKLNFVTFSTQNYTDENKRFVFLNLEKVFESDIDWNFNEYGKLWNYNLQYLNYLNQGNLTKYYKYKLLDDLHNNLYAGNVLLEPYPTSLRIINTIRFLNTLLDNPNQDKVQELLKAVYSQTLYLIDNLEYHILGNHLLENAFALLASAEFFDNDEWRKEAAKVLYTQLDEQILNDGAHFELSPMYHQIILTRVLEAISICSDPILKAFLIEKSKKMLAWLKLVTFNNGSVPHLNDSTDNIAYTTQELLNKANELNIDFDDLNQFSDSGYRKYSKEHFELVVDVNGIAPSYQPGHAHSDHLSFVLNFLNQPFIVDPGISTYNISERRNWERSSEAHNTVTLNNLNQSEVWGGFRVANRAHVEIVEDATEKIKAIVKYNAGNSKVAHARLYMFENKSIIISDEIIGNNYVKHVARYFLHPNVETLEINKSGLIFINNIQMDFENSDSIKVNNYKYSAGYNNLVDAKVIEVEFKEFLKLSIQYNKI